MNQEKKPQYLLVLKLNNQTEIVEAGTPYEALLRMCELTPKIAKAVDNNSLKKAELKIEKIT